MYNLARYLLEQEHQGSNFTKYQDGLAKLRDGGDTHQQEAHLLRQRRSNAQQLL